MIIQDGIFYIFQPKKEAKYNSVEYGKLDSKQYNSNWGSNRSAELNNGQYSPKKAVPYLYKLYLNKIMYAMTNYFFIDHDQVDAKKLEESKEILDYLVSEYNTINIDEMQSEYKGKY